MTKMRSLIDDYRAGRVMVDVFETRFLALHSEMPLDIPSVHSSAVENVFWAVESFVADPELRSADDLDEAALRSAADTAALTLAADLRRHA